MDATLDDFRHAAAAGHGVDVIPFPDLRKQAISVASEVDRCKTATARWNYDTYEKQKDNLLKEKAAKEDAIEVAKKEIEELKRRFTEVSVASEEKYQKERESDLKGIDDAINKKNSELGEAAEEWKRLWNARGGLRELCKDAVDEVSKAKSSPEKYLGSSPTDADKEIFQKSIYVIEGMIKEEEEEHKKQEEGAKGTEEKFRELIKKAKY